MPFVIEHFLKYCTPSVQFSLYDNPIMSFYVQGIHVQNVHVVLMYSY